MLEFRQGGLATKEATHLVISVPAVQILPHDAAHAHNRIGRIKPGTMDLYDVFLKAGPITQVTMV